VSIAQIVCNAFKRETWSLDTHILLQSRGLRTHIMQTQHRGHRCLCMCCEHSHTPQYECCVGGSDYLTRQHYHTARYTTSLLHLRTYIHTHWIYLFIYIYYIYICIIVYYYCVLHHLYTSMLKCWLLSHKSPPPFPHNPPTFPDPSPKPD